MITTFRYIPLGEVGKWLALGWQITDDLVDSHHGAHAVLMKFEGFE